MDEKECVCGEPKKREQIWCDECHEVRSSGRNYLKYYLQKIKNKKN
jgi:hypothetical protein